VRWRPRNPHVRSPLCWYAERQPSTPRWSWSTSSLRGADPRRTLARRPTHPNDQMSTAVLAPPASSLPAADPALPVHLTRFIGRTSELEEISRMLASTRLLTLTGAGGSGKTRLAREAAAQASANFTNTGWADLGPINDAGLVPQLMATALRLPDRAVASAVESLSASIREEQTLLVLDNCEHVIDACASLVERLLRECPRLTVLA